MKQLILQGFLSGFGNLCIDCGIQSDEPCSFSSLLLLGQLDLLLKIC